MSDNYNKAQVSTFISGDQWVFRADDGTELKDAIESVAKEADGVVGALNTLKQVGVAKGIFTGDSAKKGDAAPKERSKDLPPPGPSASNEDVPTCPHGPMLDARAAGKNWKKRWYCTERGKAKECWARD
jgi:hypothetical protein